MVALTALGLQPYHPSHSPTFTCFLKHPRFATRRIATIAALNTILLVKDVMFTTDAASGFDFRMTVPDQTVEEAASTVKEHAEDLLEVRGLLESQLWRDAQKELRRSSSLLKQDMYTLIQGKPGSERARLRVLYSQLFNNVTRLDYAARSKDPVQCKEYFSNIVVFLNDILSKL